MKLQVSIASIIYNVINEEIYLSNYCFNEASNRLFNYLRSSFMNVKNSFWRHFKS